MKNGKLVRVTAMFFALMLCFTILSRAADQMSVAVVQTERPQNRMIEHAVKASGKIVQNQELAVTTLPDQRVTAIYVREGQRVAKGDLLFEIDLTLLEEKILDQQQEMEKQELQVKDAKSQKEVSAQQKANSQAQAAEQYSLSTRQAGVQLSRAKEQLAQAQQELKKFRESNGINTEDSKVEDTLLQALEEKTDAYVAAQGELRTLEWEIENAVYTAKQAAMTGGTSAATAVNGATLTAEERTLTKEADIDLTEEDQTFTEAPDTALIGEDQAFTEAPDTVLTGEDQIFVESMEPEIVPENDIDLNTNIEGTTDQSTADQNTTNLDLTNQGADVENLETPQAPTLEELAQIEQTVRADYGLKLDAAQKKLSDAQAEKDAAEAALVQYQQEQLAASNSEDAKTAQQLAENVKAARQAYEDAAIAANEAAVTSGRAVAIANIADPSNSSDRMSEITYEQMELTLEKLEGLKKAKGRICAEADGLITKINIMTGEKTTDTTALLMADLSKGYRFTADITKEQQKYIGTGDLVKLTSGDGKQQLEDLPVESVEADENDESIYHVTVQVPEDTFEIGMNVNLDFSRKSAAYAVTVPLSALHLDEKQQTYVLLVEEYESIMGTEQRARKMSVTALEQNERYVALAEGVIGTDQEVIVQSDKAVENGSRVRVG